MSQLSDTRTYILKNKPPRWAYTHWCVGANILDIWCNEEMFLMVCTEIRAALKSGWNGRRERQTDHILEQGEWRWASKYGAEEQFRKLETFCFSGLQSLSQVKVIMWSAGCQGKIRTHGWRTKWLSNLGGKGYVAITIHFQGEEKSWVRGKHERLG